MVLGVMGYTVRATIHELYWLNRAVYVSCLVYLPLLFLNTGTLEPSLFKMKFQETLTFIRVPWGHFIYGDASS